MLRSALLVAALCLAGCSTQAGEEAASAGDTLQDTASAARGAVTSRMATSANEFAMEAARSDMYEIESSRMALEKSQNGGVKTFAQQMIDAHTATTAELKPIAAAAGITPPADLDSRRASMVENLKNASADDFDDRYLDQQTAAHTEALNLMRTYADRGDNTQMKAFAAKTAPAVEHHLEMVRQLDKGGADEAK